MGAKYCARSFAAGEGSGAAEPCMWEEGMVDWRWAKRELMEVVLE